MEWFGLYVLMGHGFFVFLAPSFAIVLAISLFVFPLYAQTLWIVIF